MSTKIHETIVRVTHTHTHTHVESRNNLGLVDIHKINNIEQNKES